MPALKVPFLAFAIEEATDEGVLLDEIDREGKISDELKEEMHRFLSSW